MKKILFALLFFLLIIPFCCADEEIKKFFPGIPEAGIKALIHDGKISRISGKDTLLFAPDTEAGQYAVNIANDFAIKTESAAIINSDKSLNGILNILLAISTIKGTPYYSSSEQAYISLFEDAYTVDSLKNPGAVPDLSLFGTLPETITSIGCLKDSRFGSNLYIFSYKISDNNISMTITNAENLKYSIFNVIEKKQFLFILDITIKNDNLFVYSAGFCNPRVLPRFLEKRINNSITNRIDALFGWFEGAIKKE